MESLWCCAGSVQPKNGQVNREAKEEECTRGKRVCHFQPVPMPEMWKRQQVHENARNMCTAEILSNNFGKMGKATYVRTRYGKKNGQAGRSFDVVQKMLRLCTTEDGTKTVELLQAGASGHKRAQQHVETNSGS